MQSGTGMNNMKNRDLPNRKVALYTFIIILGIVIINCSNEEYIKKTFQIVKYHKIRIGIVYSNDLITFKDSLYKPIYGGMYRLDSLEYILRYYCEGQTIDSYTELKRDSLTMFYLAIPINRKILIDKDYIYDNKTKYKIVQNVNDTIFYQNTADTLYKYFPLK